MQHDNPFDRVMPNSSNPDVILAARTILLAEDDDAIRSYVVRLLRRHGFQVLAARHGKEALELAEQHIGDIVLLLTDVVMPHMGGFELAARFRELRPDAKIVMMSGSTQGHVIPRGVSDGTTPFIQKPFETQQLMRTVQRSLDEFA